MTLNCSYKFNNQKKYVVACSFGPDSMALLNYLFVNGIDVIVAHVNYHKRDVSNFEENSLKTFCESRKIPFEVLDTTGMEHKGNFQEWARDIRYNFFKQIVEKYNAEGVVVAHQEDDVIETYLMQKKRGIYTKNAGIAEKIDKNGLTIIRPFLKNKKEDLLNYDNENNVPYSVDVSNLTSMYKRNEIRHSIVEKMNAQERLNIIEEINQKNKEIESNIFEAESLGDCIDFVEFEGMDLDKIRNWIIFQLDNAHFYRPISLKFVKEIKLGILKNENIYFYLTDNFGICRNNGKIRIFQIKIPCEIKLSYGEKYNDDFVEIDFTMGAEDRNIQSSDYPLTIKVPSPKDKYKVSNYFKEVRRLFIDWKMPQYLRKMWLGVYSKEGNLIYLPRYRENYVDNHKSVFKIKVK